MKNIIISADGDRKVYLFPNEKSVFVKNLGWIDFRSKLPAPYCDYLEFNF